MLDFSKQSEILSKSPSIKARPDWPEGAAYRYDRTGHQILRVVRGIAKAKAAWVVQEPVDLALFVDGPLLVMCSRVGESLPWAGASYHWHRVGQPDRLLPDPTAEARLDLVLMEGKGGRVRATRSLLLPADFSRMLHESILEQSRYTYDPGEERRAMATLLRRCPTPNAIAAYAVVKAHLVG